MSDTTPIPPNVTAARALVASSDYYALGFLTLSMASYYAVGQSEPFSQLIQGIDSQFTNPGTWQLDWGPASSAANLLYFASYRDQESGLPIFGAVVLRGTEPDTSLFGIIKQLREDLGGGTQVSWPSGGALISEGTYNGMNTVLALEGPDSNGNQMALVEFLMSFLPTVPGMPLVVTGHSLGGCLTSAVALNLASQSICEGFTIVPVTFAAPTAGNQAYVDLYTTTFPGCKRWFNNWDLVPLAYAGIEDMYMCWGMGVYNKNPLPFGSCHAPLGANAADIIGDIKTLIQGKQYVHEGDPAQRTLQGGCLATPSSTSSSSSADENWYSELLLQHLPACGYWTLMTKQYSSSLGGVTYPSWAPPLTCTAG